MSVSSRLEGANEDELREDIEQLKNGNLTLKMYQMIQVSVTRCVMHRRIRLGPYKQDSEDAISEITHSIVENGLRNYRADIGTIDKYVRGAARNLLNSWVKRNRVRPERRTIPLAPHVAGRPATEDLAVLIARVAKETRSLTTQEMLLLFLLLDGLTNVQIAMQLRKTVKAVYTAKYRLKMKIVESIDVI